MAKFWTQAVIPESSPFSSNTKPWSRAHRSSQVGPSIFSQQPFPNAVLRVPAASWMCPAPANLHASAQGVLMISKALLQPLLSSSSPLPSPSSWPHRLTCQDSTRCSSSQRHWSWSRDLFSSSFAATRNHKHFRTGWSTAWRILLPLLSLPLPSPCERVPCPVPLPWPHHLLWQGNVRRCKASGDLKSAAWFGCALVHLSCICHGGVSHVVSGPKRTNTWSRSEPNPPAWLKCSQPGALSRTASGDPWVHEIEKIKTTALCLWEFWWVTDVSHCTIVPRIN